MFPHLNYSGTVPMGTEANDRLLLIEFTAQFSHWMDLLSGMTGTLTALISALSLKGLGRIPPGVELPREMKARLQAEIDPNLFVIARAHNEINKLGRDIHILHERVRRWNIVDRWAKEVRDSTRK